MPTVEDRKFHVSDEFIAELIIGIKAPADHRNEMIQIAVDKGIPVYQAVQVPMKFRIDRERIA